MMRAELLMGAALLAMLAMPARAEGVPPAPEPEPPRVTPDDPDRDPWASVAPRPLYDYCCAAPDGGRVVKSSAHLFQRKAHAQCAAAQAETLIACTARQMGSE